MRAQKMQDAQVTNSLMMYAINSVMPTKNEEKVFKEQNYQEKVG